MSDTNELGQEKSPYLKQHAHNPVHWKAWGDRAFAVAKISNKPIFLSIGYSTCHWCHVMEKESFENQQIADFLNEHFVSIKIDREELPEVDAQYMYAVQVMTRHGGWPMSVFLDHELRPFYAGTYFPPKNFTLLLGKISELWKQNIAEIHRVGAEMQKVLLLKEENVTRPSSTELGIKFFQESALMLDSEVGGHKGAPKFPMNYELISAHRLASNATEREQALRMSKLTLEKMLSGGIWDHVGGGLHRYSTDDEWRVPHFEKMLYDQASLLSALSENLAVAKNDFFHSRAEKLLEYLERDLKISGGAFYSAEDADSEGHEGTFYVWSYEELKKLMSTDEFSDLKDDFEIKEDGNWEQHIVLHARQPEKKSSAAIWKKLLAIRSKRPRPLRDEKIITSWNGLMIAALSRYGRVTASVKAIEMAKEAAAFLQKNLYQNKKLSRRWIDGEAKFEAQLEDYAFLIEGLIELYQTTSDKKHLDWALELQKQVDLEFFRAERNSYINNTRTNLLRENQDWSDNVTPSALSATLINLFWLGEFTLDTTLMEKAEKCLNTTTEALERHPIAYSRLIEAVDLVENPRETVAIICADTCDEKEKTELLKKIEAAYKPRRKMLIATESEKKEHPLLADKPLKFKPFTIYICSGKTCSEPKDTYG